MGEDAAAHLAVAKLVYFSKATWMIVLVWLCALRLPFRQALAISFFYYAVALLGEWLMGTLQPLDDGEPVRFGITRDVNTASFRDVHFGEFMLLWRDLRKVSTAREYLGYLFRPPGWKPQGKQQTGTARKQRARLRAASEATRN